MIGILMNFDVKRNSKKKKKKKIIVIYKNYCELFWKQTILSIVYFRIDALFH